MTTAPIADNEAVFYDQDQNEVRIAYPDQIDLGDGHILRVITESGRITAVTEYHMNNGVPCGGIVPVGEYTRDNWQVKDPRVESFTLSPSINCTECRSHGVVEKGKWIDFSSHDGGNAFTRWLRKMGFTI